MASPDDRIEWPKFDLSGARGTKSSQDNLYWPSGSIELVNEDLAKKLAIPAEAIIKRPNKR